MALFSQFHLLPKNLLEKIGEKEKERLLESLAYKIILFAYFRILNIEYCSMCLKYYFYQE